MRQLRVHVSISIVAGLLLISRLAEPAQPGEPSAPIPLKTNLDTRRAAIGERLFHDVRLSRGQNESCASCHPLDRGGMDGLPVAVRTDGSWHLRNTPTVFNVGLNATFNWDGVAQTLEDHTDRVIQTLMRIGWEELIARLRRDPGYFSDFKAAYGDSITRANILDAFAVFEKSLLTPNARFDRFLRGQKDALTPKEARGYRLFQRYGCITCHQGVNMGGNLFQKFGVFEDMARGKVPLADAGRIRITKIPRDDQVFRVPSLRNVAVTAPYFHDGREPELTKAVETMSKVQLGKEPPPEDIDLLVAFLRTLTGEFRGAMLVAPSPEATR